MKRAFVAMLLLAAVVLPAERELCHCCSGTGRCLIRFDLHEFTNINPMCYGCNGWGYVQSEFSRNTDPNPKAVAP